MKAVILAGGLGTRISEETHLKPKPMIEIGGKPILWHIMKTYSAHGVNDFVICCGYKGYLIKEYFANYFLHMSDVTFDMAKNEMKVHQQKAEPWRVTLVDTGEDTLTGGRLRRVADYVKDDESFCFTYGDGLSNVDIRASIAFHKQHGKLATVTAVQPPGRYGALQREGDAVTAFTEKPRGDGGLINGGFFVLSPRCIDLIADDQTPWESEPMGKLAESRQMMAFEHLGFWQPMDTLREKNMLEELWSSGQAPLENMAVMQANPSPDFWRGKRVLLTGHTGFKGSWLALWLHRLGARVVGVSVPPEASPNLFEIAGIDGLCQSHFCDIRDSEALAALVRQSAPDIVLHLAAQSLVRTSYREPLRTFATNIQGTANLLDALRDSESVKVAVVVTTDKVYQNLERQRPFAETDPLGGHDPYSASKAASEIIIASYRDAYLAERGVALASARAGNVIGGGDWSDDRLIPDAIRAWNQGVALEVRRPQGVRPWQHVLEPLSGYLRLAEALWRQPALAGAYNFGPETREAAPVREVIELARSVYGRGEVNWGDGSDGPHEAGWLSLEITKSKQQLGVSPRWNLAQTVARTMDWYRLQAQGGEAATLCAADITAYEAAQGTATA